MNQCACGKTESPRWYKTGTLCNACYERDRKKRNADKRPTREPCIDCGSTSPGDRTHGRCNKCSYRSYYRQNPQAYKDRVAKRIKDKPEAYKQERRLITNRKRHRIKQAMSPDQYGEYMKLLWAMRASKMSDKEKEKRRQRSLNWHLDPSHKEDKIKNFRKAKEKRRARQHAVLCTLTRQDWLNLIELYEGCCAYCGKKCDNITQDHVIPISKGGPHTKQNVVPACQKCNRTKGVNPPPNGWVQKPVTF